MSPRAEGEPSQEPSRQPAAGGAGTARSRDDDAELEDLPF